MVQNALVAYALCQHWGNVPEQFADIPGPVPPGLTLLRLLDGGDAALYETNSPGLRKRVGVHPDSVLATRPDNALFHDFNSLTYHYTVEGPGHQIIFTDTRTCRSFPSVGGEAPVLLPPDQLQAQIANTPPTGDRALLVVISSNAPPVLPIRTATRHAALSNHFRHFPDIYESWELPADATDRLFKAISEKLPLVGGERRGCAMLLSGDVHMSFASRLIFKAKSRFEDDQANPQRVTAVFAQLVASSLRKQSDDTVDFHREGYRTAPWYLPVPISELEPEVYVGWNVPSGVSQTVAEGRILGTGAPAFGGGADTARDRPSNNHEAAI